MGNSASGSNKKSLDSLNKHAELTITNRLINNRYSWYENILKWAVRGDYLYFIDNSSGGSIVVYSISKRRVERVLPHNEYVRNICFDGDFAFVGNRFLVSASRYLFRVWDVNNRGLLATKPHECQFNGPYFHLFTISPTSFLQIDGCTIRRFDISMAHSTTVQLDQVNKKTFDDYSINLEVIWPSEVCEDKIAFIFEKTNIVSIFDVKTFKVIAQVDLSPHLEGFPLYRSLLKRIFDISFTDRIVLCVGGPAELKILLLDSNNLSLQKAFIVSNQYHPIPQLSNLSMHFECIWMDANVSVIRVQHTCYAESKIYYKFLEVSIKEGRVTS